MTVHRAASTTVGRSRALWLGPVLAWVAMAALLALNVVIAQLPPTPPKAIANLVIAGLQALLMGWVFMRLNRASSLTRLTAAGGLLWVLFLFVMMGADYFTRP